MGVPAAGFAAVPGVVVPGVAVLGVVVFAGAFFFFAGAGGAGHLGAGGGVEAAFSEAACVCTVVRNSSICFLLHSCDLLNLISKRDARFLKIRQRLLQLAHLVSGSRDARGFDHVHQHVIQRVHVDRNRKNLAQRPGRRVPFDNQLRHGSVHIALNCIDVLSCFIAHAALLPLVQIHRTHGLQHFLEGRFQNFGRRSRSEGAARRSSCGHCRSARRSLGSTNKHWREQS